MCFTGSIRGYSDLNFAVEIDLRLIAVEQTTLRVSQNVNCTVTLDIGTDVAIVVSGTGADIVLSSDKQVGHRFRP